VSQKKIRTLKDEVDMQSREFYCTEKLTDEVQDAPIRDD
jgi:hypothetical protein